MASRPAKTPQQMQQNWQTGMGGAGATWAARIQATTVNPGQLALAQKGKAIQNYGNALNGQHYANVMQNFDVAGWKQRCAAAAQAGAFTRGATRGQAAYGRFAAAAQPVYADMKRTAAAAGGWQQAVVQSISLLIAAGSKNGNGMLKGR